MNIVLTVNTAWNIWNFRKTFVKKLLSNGHRVTVIAPPDSSVSDLLNLGCQFIPLEMSAKGLNPLGILRLLYQLNNKFEQLNPDVILSFTIKNNIFGAFIAKYKGIQFIPNVTGLGTAFLSGGVLQALAANLYKAAFKDLPVIFVQNCDDRDLFISLRLTQEYQLRILPGSGIDLDRFEKTEFPAKTNPVRFIMIARLMRDKGTIEFVEAARIVKKIYPHVQFQLLGATDSENRYAVGAADVDRWVAEGLVEYLGVAEDVRPFIAAAHCTVLPSYREGAPRTLIEAAAMCRPLIATDVPGCRSVIDNGVTGLLCAPKSVESLAGAFCSFLSLSPNDQKAMGIAGRKKMETEFDVNIVISAYVTALNELNSRNKEIPSKMER